MAEATRFMFKGKGPLALAERDAELERQKRREAEQAREAKVLAMRRQAEDLAEAGFHSVTVSTRLSDEGTPDERRVVESIKFTCSAPEDARCRTYPDDCGCEQWSFGAAGSLDDDGHERTSGNDCWLKDWFAAGGSVFVGADYDDMRDDGVPAIDRSGNITVSFIDDWVEWDFVPAEVLS